MVYQIDIERELNQKLPEVSDLLASLDVAIGFLVSVGGEADDHVIKFMIETLKMKQPHLAYVVCQLSRIST